MTSETIVSGDELLAEILSGSTADKDIDDAKDTDEDIDLDKLKQRKPPKDGPCKRCGDDKPLNRLMLCYKCWVLTNLEDQVEGWKAGDQHPGWCQCEGLTGHESTRRGAGN